MASNLGARQIDGYFNANSKVSLYGKCESAKKIVAGTVDYLSEIFTFSVPAYQKRQNSIPSLLSQIIINVASYQICIKILLS